MRQASNSTIKPKFPIQSKIGELFEKPNQFAFMTPNPKALFMNVLTHNDRKIEIKQETVTINWQGNGDVIPTDSTPEFRENMSKQKLVQDSQTCVELLNQTPIKQCNLEDKDHLRLFTFQKNIENDSKQNRLTQSERKQVGRE